MQGWATILLLIVGTAFTVTAALGVARMPDLYTRMQASTKALTLGVGCLLLAVSLHTLQLRGSVQALLILAFLVLTAPVAAQMLARAAHFDGVRQWKDDAIDEMREQPGHEGEIVEAELPPPREPS